jgi:pSer/pThr/pTyr-binding forkhead associated (FHA) protein
MQTPQRDPFSSACGLTGPLELEVSSPQQQRQRYTFDQPWLVLGRDGRLPLPLHDAAISRRHVYLQVLGGRLLAVDLESRTGLGVAGARSLSAWIDPGQPLTVGPFEVGRGAGTGLVPAPWSAPGDPLEDPPPENLPLPRASFDILLEGDRVARWRLNRVLALVGGSTRCRVRLRGPEVAPIHCGLVATPNGVWVIDLCTATGTRLHGAPLQAARLEEGDTLEIANYSLRLNNRARVAATVPAPVPDVGDERTGLAPSAPAESAPNSPLLVLCGENPGTGIAPASGANALVPLVQQFNAMQQHMFGQFQQTLVMLVQMMTSMHQEQVALIRDEMRQFHKATEELTRLQEQARQGRPTVGPSPVRPSSPPVSPPVAPAPLVHGSLPETTAASNGAALDDWLTQRISQLETERQTSWQRILGFLRGT